MTIQASKEIQVLLSCGLAEHSPHQKARLDRLLQEGNLSWEKIRNEARWHRLSAFLFRNLREYPGESLIPTKSFQEFERAYHQNLSCNFYFRKELQKILYVLQEHSIPVVVLKGAALIEDIYGDLGVRPMSDLDILVPQEQARQAFSLIQSIGYIPGAGDDDLEWSESHHHHLTQLFQRDGPSIVEVHTHILEPGNPLRFDIANFWNRAEYSRIAGTRVLTLCPEDLLTHLCLHFLRDRESSSYSALGQLVDITQVARSQAHRIDWNLLYKEAAANGLTGPVFCGLYLAQLLFEAPIPGEILNNLRPDSFRTNDAERFIRLRVLGRNWMVKGLISAKYPYHWRSIPLAAIRRAFRGKVSSGDRPRTTLGPNRFFYGTYLQRLKKISCAFIRLITAPVGAYEDLATDRWVHNLYSQHRSA